MDIGLYRIEWTGLAGVGRSLSRRFDEAALKIAKPRFVWFPVVLVAGAGIWVLLSGSASNVAESEPVGPVAPVASTPGGMAATPATIDAPKIFDPATTEAIVPEQTAPVDGLKISSQSWRRGGLGSNALVTFTLRNRNDYAVRNIEISCAFTRRDGSHLTDRTRLIPDMVNMKSRKTFARMHVGFVNINASKAKCALVTASRI